MAKKKQKTRKYYKITLKNPQCLDNVVKMANVYGVKYRIGATEGAIYLDIYDNPKKVAAITIERFKLAVLDSNNIKYKGEEAELIA